MFQERIDLAIEAGEPIETTLDGGKPVEHDRHADAHGDAQEHHRIHSQPRGLHVNRRCYNGIMKPNLIEAMSDQQLLTDLRSAAACERHATAHLIALLAEMDIRRLYLAEGYSSLFTYCTQCLRLSEHAAYGRIEAARAARRFPIVLERLMEGAITLTTVCLLAKHLTDKNHLEILEAARYKSKREVEQQVATLAPKPDVPSRVQKVATTAVASVTPPIVESTSPNVPIHTDVIGVASLTAQIRRQPVIAPLAPERYKVQITVSRETHDKLRRVQDLMRHVVPNGDPAVILDRALTLLLEHLERGNLRRWSVRVRAMSVRVKADTYPRQLGVRSGRATRANALLLVPTDVARREDSLNFIM